MGVSCNNLDVLFRRIKSKLESSESRNFPITIKIEDDASKNRLFVSLSWGEVMEIPCSVVSDYEFNARSKSDANRKKTLEEVSLGFFEIFDSSGFGTISIDLQRTRSRRYEHKVIVSVSYLTTHP